MAETQHPQQTVKRHGALQHAAIYLLSGLLRAYQLFISPMLGHHCRFYPSCSSYAMQAIEQHGIIGGLRLAIKRLSKCHPWHCGGIDHVPD